MPNFSQLLTAFRDDIRRRVAAEEVLAKFTDGPDLEEARRRRQLSQTVHSRDAELAVAEEEHAAAVTGIESTSAAEMSAADQFHRRRVQEIESRAAKAQQELEKQKNDSAWVVSSVLDDTAEDSPAREFERFKALLTKSREDQVTEWTHLLDAVNQVLAERGWTGKPAIDFGTPPQDREAAAARFAAAVASTRGALKQFRSLLLPQLFKGFRSLVLFIVLLAAVATPVYLYADPQLAGVVGDRFQAGWIGVSAILGGVASLIVTLVLYSLGSMRQSEILRQIQNDCGETEWAHHHWLRLAKEQLSKQQKEFEVQQRLIERDRHQSLKRFDSAHAQRRAQIEQERATDRSEEDSRYAAEHANQLNDRQTQLAELNAKHSQRVHDLQQRWADSIASLEFELESYVSERRRQRQAHWTQLRADWTQASQAFETTVQASAKVNQREFPTWLSLAQHHWTPPTEIPTAVRLGDYQIDLAQWEGAISPDARLAPRVTQHAFPANVTFPQSASVLFASPNAQAREQAINGLQTLMLRLLTLLPPGKLRFTIIDPVGLGESFGGFMHLADYDEMLVTSRIWTEANQIESRLADLTEHMENVLQKYLRNEFSTIEEYNESAGEVAEPYHFLVISDFPAKFSEIAARRLVSIVNSGPRCGVYTLMNFDPGKQLPNNFSMADIEGRMTKLMWREGAFHSPEPEVINWPLHIDPPPRPDDFTTIVKKVGEASKDARRVEVSFARITPDADQLWKGDSRKEVSIPLGRAGATKLQELRLGKGTSQHMLVAGKTGSGKSTFLHILITNLALYYSPDEVNFFLIDFKKGVEFKDYATHHLPHARVIAVESDREFGVSALQRLGDILQERGELFRKHGVQDIAGYRNTTGKPLPRILLVIDEFQEFFVEDDKIGQNAALLLDRLVRQGRAFGIHVILGSQTLGGAYSLARSTLGQVAVRVALQCSEADAHLILSEDNTAARLLTRPGEAIYNDANGMFEGNHPFQIAWITDEQREQALARMQVLLQQRRESFEPAIVFEGNIPSDLTRNPRVAELVGQYATREAAIATPTIWLGDAVEIAPPTSVTFHRQSGNHLLLVGQDSDAALGVMSAALMTLAASLSPRQEQNSLFVLDGSHRGTAEASAWEQLSGEFESDVRLIRPEETGLFLQAIAAELKQREEQNQTDAPPLFLLVFNIARFRDLRKTEDDFGMGGFGMGSSEPKPAEPGKIFADLLAKGPAYGMHVIVWCDSNNNVERWFSRQTLKELELRIAFQMNASDSSNLIDSPAASRLGTHRALLYREETGTSEKFRPYGLPSMDWLRAAHRRMLNKPDDNVVTDLEEFTIS
ncbi:FtsK/SpoIIIE domain-containing protein [Planctomicrobium piriforme]|uniref:FtsK/SpoIIIE family protein n=1 Tax=Planctomicrobium piriforme TaxID=1576369 RepID=A0A1I3G2S2_9PLAN|nr:FtsK/SpoIIIE domain-containing protein [Planctomicrobium piriforme]SFI17562.1 FtsK/SpoIIIE family protein [Planctomicrobium piriforme]